MPHRARLRLGGCELRLLLRVPVVGSVRGPELHAFLARDEGVGERAHFLVLREPTASGRLRVVRFELARGAPRGTLPAVGPWAVRESCAELELGLFHEDAFLGSLRLIMPTARLGGGAGRD